MGYSVPRLTSRPLIVACLLLALPAGWFGVYAVSPQDGAAPNETIEIHRSDSRQAILRTLVEKGVVKRPAMFMWLGRITRRWSRIKAGEYKVSAAMSPISILRTLDSGISLAHPITVREGENMYEVAADIEAKGLAPASEVLALCRDRGFIATLGLDPDTSAKAQVLEGFLFPDTYDFNKTMTAEQMLRQMVRHANHMWTQEDQREADTIGMSRYEVITLASIIEKETGDPEERPLVSSVFHNRLKKKMKLQSDPTTIYGMWSRYRGNIHRSDLREANPYNTYYVPALPEGPIANPGAQSIAAALKPANTDYLFFVSHNDGTHQFSRSLSEHNAAVRRYQLDPQARDGKSWRDLRKTFKRR